MSIDSALYTRLGAFSGLSALVGSRIYPPPAPQNGEIPYITFFQVSGVRIYAMGNQTPLVDARFQIDVYSDSSIEARAVAEQVRLALSHYHGTSDSVTIDLITIENEQRIYEPDTGLHRMSQDYMVSYREAQPA